RAGDEDERGHTPSIPRDARPTPWDRRPGEDGPPSAPLPQASHRFVPYEDAMGQRISRWARLFTAAALLSVGLTAVDAAPAHASALSHEAGVDANGPLVTGVGVVRVKHITIGQYEVTFDIRVNGCSYTASI